MTQRHGVDGAKIRLSQDFSDNGSDNGCIVGLAAGQDPSERAGQSPIAFPTDALCSTPLPLGSSIPDISDVERTIEEAQRARRFRSDGP